MNTERLSGLMRSGSSKMDCTIHYTDMGVKRVHGILRQCQAGPQTRTMHLSSIPKPGPYLDFDADCKQRRPGIPE